jgi:hypothetical protein
LREVRGHAVLHDKTKRNPLKNRGFMKRLNPYEATRLANEAKAQKERHEKKVATLKATRKATKKAQSERRKKFSKVATGLQESFKVAEQEYIREVYQKVEESEEEED